MRTVDSNNQESSLKFESKPSQLPGKMTRFPVHCFPFSINKVIENLYLYTRMPLELIANIMLTILSFICQYLVSVVSPYTGVPGPCSLYLLTLAESGEGKTFLFNLLMRPVHQRFKEMSLRYYNQLTEYRNKHRIWTTGLQGLNASLRQATKTGYGVEDAQVQLETYYKNEPKRPLEPKFIYEDVTFKALIQGLSKHGEAGIIMDEAISFFRSVLKNHLGLLNKGWDGGTYDFTRADGESYELQLCLMLSLMVQPGVFMNYLEKHGEIARNSGFIARFLITQVKSSIGQRHSRVDGDDLDAVITSFHNRLRELLGLIEKRFYDKNIDKDTLELSDEAKKILQEKRDALEYAIAPGGKWAHIRDFASKAIEQVLRLAAILEFFSQKETQATPYGGFFNTGTISGTTIKNALEIMEWYLQQASNLFYPMSPQYQFEADIRELWRFINDTLLKTGGIPFPKHDLERYGPNRLRRIENLTPVLNELISQGYCCIIQINNSKTLYVAGVVSNGTILISDNLRYQIVQSKPNTSSSEYNIDLSDMPYGGLVW
ncbi:YfjI family protein [Buttiauxella sp. S04-F03]|uniref:YfjI family protein n=1 Tax=Buttiauxella sp. S04-F03 TaxID=2904525 RepID=UPI001E522ADB|nr:YfjI family protein [Buttiauxella sp. S04-F03]MCE0813559.1 DUF3987 domain-containing protein [Buttiauxella sp. S04-F03]